MIRKYFAMYRNMLIYICSCVFVVCQVSRENKDTNININSILCCKRNISIKTLPRGPGEPTEGEAERG